MQKTDSRYIVQPVDKALRVLRCLADEGRALTLTEVTYMVRLPKTTVFRYLATLRKWDLVVHDPQTDLYRLGPYLTVLAQRVCRSPALREAALPVMKRLRDRFNETVNLSELDRQDVVYLEIVESRQSLRMQAVVGSRDPAYATAVGKAILASLPEAEWTNHLPEILDPRTPHTHRTHAALRADLVLTRQRGFATDRGENEAGAMCIAAPIRIGAQVLGAISLSAPLSRITPVLEPQFAQAVRQAAAAIATAIGEADASSERLL